MITKLTIDNHSYGVVIYREQVTGDYVAQMQTYSKVRATGADPAQALENLKKEFSEYLETRRSVAVSG